jgi:hypothetical protein
MAIFKRKEESYSIKEFMSKGRAVAPVVEPFEFKEEVRESISVLGAISVLPLAVQPFFKSMTANAAEVVQSVPASGAIMYDKMLHAFDPLVGLIQALAYPVAMVVVLGGALFIMIGNKEKGFGMMQGAGLGYVLVQMCPMVLNILVEAMKAV